MYIGDIIIKEGTIGSKMYFIQEGIVDIVMANGEVRISSFHFMILYPFISMHNDHLYDYSMTRLEFLLRPRK